jgi:membrane-bound acyltransferase YfiQ involved in biofilm formation
VIIAIILLTIFEKISIGYFTYLGIWFELLGTIAILGFSTVEFLYCKPFKDISNFSFSIYLVHMVVIGLIDRVYNLHFVISIFSTAMVILICYIVFLFARWFAKLIKADKIILPILGIRLL